MSERLLTTREAAALTGMSIYWFRKKRFERKDGPEFIKFGDSNQGGVRYKESSLMAWFDSKTRKPEAQDKEQKRQQEVKDVVPKALKDVF